MVAEHEVRAHYAPLGDPPGDGESGGEEVTATVRYTITLCDGREIDGLTSLRLEDYPTIEALIATLARCNKNAWRVTVRNITVA